MTKRKGGLNPDAGKSLFQPTGDDKPEPESSPDIQQPLGEEVRERTTIMLSLSTRSLLDRLKTDARRNGLKTTHSAIIEAALIEYAKLRGIKT